MCKLGTPINFMYVQVEEHSVNQGMLCVDITITVPDYSLKSDTVQRLRDVTRVTYAPSAIEEPQFVLKQLSNSFPVKFPEFIKRMKHVQRRKDYEHAE